MLDYVIRLYHNCRYPVSSCHQAFNSRGIYYVCISREERFDYYRFANLTSRNDT